MEWFALVIPILVALGALLIWGKKLTWWEIIIPIGVTAIVILSMKIAMSNYNMKDTEYLSSYIEKVVYYEPWNEYIHKTCSYTTSSGSGKYRTTTTHYYDCSYVDYHPARWEAILKGGKTIDITEQYYHKICKLWGNVYFVEMNRNYHTLDGNAYASNWNGQFKTLIQYSWEDTYDNRPQAAISVFNFKPLDSIELKKVVDYPKVISGQQKVCIKCVEEDNKTLSKINALYGYSKQIKIFVILFKNKDISAATLQKRYWKGGNKNELVICADVDSKWCQSFSWSDDKRLESNINHLFTTKNLTLNQKLYKVKELVPELWVRKKFKDFEYIDVELSTTQLMYVHVISLLITIGILIWGVKNDIEQD